MVLTHNRRKASPVVQVFTKYPHPGQVKTRLAHDTGGEEAAEVHRELVLRQLQELMRLPPFYQLELWGNADANRPFYHLLLSKWPRLRYCRQQEGDLGVKLRHALARASHHSTCVLQMGTDCPVLQADDIKIAASACQQQADVVFIPAEDGGYVLGAYRSYHSAMFDAIEWSTERVLSQALSRLWRLGYSTATLPTMWDIDRIADLQRYREMQARAPLRSSPSTAYSASLEQAAVGQCPR